ncbi:MAG TPA: hypothetical protein PLS69_12270 [Terricaulis sp.]|nr:hypothetical protein [Terricaulis sp.]
MTPSLYVPLVLLGLALIFMAACSALAFDRRWFLSFLAGVLSAWCFLLMTLG